MSAGIQNRPNSQRGLELGAAQVTANPPAATTTAFVAVTGLSVTVTIGARPVVIHFHCGQVINGLTTQGVFQLGLFSDGVEIAEATSLLPATQFAGSAIDLTARAALSAGPHTFDIRQKVGAAGQNGNLLASATSPILLEVVEA